MDRKRLSVLALSACLGISVLAGCSQTGNPASSFPPEGSSSPEWGEWHQWGDIGDGAYANPVLPADFSDIDCIKAGKWYYAITSTFQYSPGMLVLRSSDLVHWQYWSHAVNDLTRYRSKYGEFTANCICLELFDSYSLFREHNLIRSSWSDINIQLSLHKMRNKFLL